MFKRLMLSIMWMFAISGLYAQNRTVKGSVADTAGTPLSNVSIVVKGTTVGTQSAADGTFTLTVPASASVLLISSINYQKQEVLIGSGELKIVLHPSVSSLDNVTVVSVGYGTLNRREVTSAVTHISSKELLPVAGNGAIMASQGKVAGLSITNQAPADPNSSPSIQLRGASSRQAGLGPLFVVNGIAGGNIDNLNQNDIESIDVLKGGAASAIYGTRGSNGVIIITTKKGTSQTKAFYDGYVSFDMPTNRVEVLSADDFIKYSQEGSVSLRRTGVSVAKTDWLGSITRDKAISQKHTLQFSGGSSRTNYMISADYRNAEGLDIRSKKEEYGARLNLTHTSENNLYSASFNIAPRYIKSNNSSWNAFNQALTLNPTLPIRDTANPSQYFYTSNGLSGSYNPVEELETVLSGTEGKYLDWSGSFKVNILSNLNTQITLGQQTQDFFDFGFTPSTNSNVVNGNKVNTGYRNYNKSDQRSLEWIGNYSLDVKKHAFKLLAGYSFYYFINSGVNASNSNFPSDALLYNNLGTGIYDQPIPAGSTGDFTYRGVGSYKNDSKLVAFFGRLNYDFDRKYFLTASLRREGSSKFGYNNKWGYFPAASVGWRISEERFYPRSFWLSDLKLRADYGVAGNQDFGSYGSLDLYGPFGYYSYNGVYYQVWGPSQNTNYNLKWEKSENINIGLDFELFDKLTGSINYYRRTNKDLLGSYNVSIPPNIREQTNVNVGTMRNSGIELQLGGSVYSTKSFDYNLSFAGAYNDNQFISFSNQTYTGQNYSDVAFLSGPGIGSIPVQRLQEGMRIGSFYMLKSAGLDATGRILVYGSDGKVIPANKASTNDKQFVGNGLPKYTASLGNNFRYQNFELNIYLRGAFGYKIFNTTAFFIGSPIARSNANVLASAYGSGKYAALTNAETASSITDYFLEQGDFVKLDNVTLAYNFPSPIKFINSGRFYITGRNLYTFTKFTTGDPEAVQVNGLTPGINTSMSYYPSSLQVLAGLQFKF